MARGVFDKPRCSARSLRDRAVALLQHVERADRVLRDNDLEPALQKTADALRRPHERTDVDDSSTPVDLLVVVVIVGGRVVDTPELARARCDAGEGHGVNRRPLLLVRRGRALVVVDMDRLHLGLEVCDLVLEVGGGKSL